ncbi:MAG: heme NO-binding domain-containing protein [Pseudomonadota bacterium]
MLGMVFTEFLEMVEQRYSPELADQMLTETGLPNDGAYTAVGYYPYEEMQALVATLSRLTGSSASILIQVYGEHLFQRFVELYPQMLQHCHDAFSLLASVDGHVHQEVHKLYPQTQLPTFETAEHTPVRLVLIYRSSRGLADLAEGLIRGCIRHYGEAICVRREDLPVSDGISTTCFEMTRA